MRQFLASDDVSFCTGGCYRVDGGLLSGIATKLPDKGSLTRCAACRWTSMQGRDISRPYDEFLNALRCLSMDIDVSKRPEILPSPRR